MKWPNSVDRSSSRGDPDRALRVSSTPRLLLGLLWIGFAVLDIPVGPARALGRSDERRAQISDVEDSLAHDPSYKVRVDAAIVLGRLGQPRSLPALVAALKDGHPSVRASAAYALGQYSSPLARDALTQVLHDPAPLVRHMAQQALRRTGGLGETAPREPGQAGIHRRAPAATRPSFEVKEMGDPQHRAGPVLRSHMRDFLVDQLRPIGEVSPADSRGTYAIDGVIKSLDVATTGREVEVTCAVQLVISRQPQGGVFLITSGEATASRPRHLWRPEQRASMEMQALEAAVRGASEDLVQHLARQ